MATITKRELIERIAIETGVKKHDVKSIVQCFLTHTMRELGMGNRLEFRDFGIFEAKIRAARRAQNPKTLEPVDVPQRRGVKFKAGKLMQLALDGETNLDRLRFDVNNNGD